MTSSNGSVVELTYINDCGAFCCPNLYIGINSTLWLIRWFAKNVAEKCLQNFWQMTYCTQYCHKEKSVVEFTSCAQWLSNIEKFYELKNRSIITLCILQNGTFHAFCQQNLSKYEIRLWLPTGSRFGEVLWSQSKISNEVKFWQVA